MKKNISGIINYMKQCLGVEREFFLEITMPLTLYLPSPARNAVSERTASTMWRIKNWLRSTMTQERLNHAILLSIQYKSTDKLDVIDIANRFCKINDER